MRIIDADKINFIWTPIAPIYISDDVHYESIAFKKEIDVQPTIDPIKHAHWIAVNPDRDGKNASIFECSNCDATVHFHFFVKNSDCRKSCGYYYCPQCGAKMDEATERDNNN